MPPTSSGLVTSRPHPRPTGAVRLLLALVLALALAASLLSGPAPVAAQPADAPPPIAGRAASLLPPGNSGFVSVDGQAAGTAGGSYGEHLDDQSDLYWGLEGYAGQGFADPAAAVRTDAPTDAVRIHWDDFGVPAVYGDTGRDVWLGAGYAVAQIRLFLLDAVRRMGRGTFAELVGTPGVPVDVQTRVLTYSQAEYEAMYAGLSAEARDAVDGYVDGVNLWIEEVAADPSLLPAEYALLSSTPQPLDAVDVLAAGVLITRTVASEGGGEMDNVALLQQLEAQYGRDAGRAVFTDFVWNDDPAAVTTVPREEGAFPNVPLSDGSRGADGHVGRAAFDAMADWAVDLPVDALSEGSGTGAHPEPVSVGAVDPAAEAPEGVLTGAAVPGVAEALTEDTIRAFVESMAALRGGSIAAAIGPSRTADGGALLLSGPQLGYSYPSLLVELEVHGGGYDARGASVPSLPTVGIGYTDRVAWGLTTGYSKTIDSFIETVRGPVGQLEHHHDGEWVPVDCRTESIPFRETTSVGLPVGPAVRSEVVDVCRTVHGPIVAIEAGDGERLARAVQYQMAGREIDTVDGILAWNRADGLADFEAAMRLVTWNENTTYADADGHIAFWHPGIHRARPVDADLRLPMPGDGTSDFGAILPFESLPQAIDPAQGYLANWNNKPAHGWFDGVGVGPTSRPGGSVQRVSAANRLIESRDDHTLATLQALEQEAGLVDVRAGAFLPVIVPALQAEGGRLAEVADLLAGWNQRHNDPIGAPETFGGPGGGTADGLDSPAATIFDAVVDQLLVELFSDVPAELLARQSGVGSHVYDASPAHNLALRVLAPATSGLVPSRDYAGGRTAAQVVVDATTAALAALEAEHGSTALADLRRPTAQSTVGNLTGVIGPSATRPYQDRGSYIHTVAFDPPPALQVERAAGDERIATSVAASQLAFPGTADTVVVAAAEAFPDALTAAPLAGAVDGPLLLVGSALPASVAAEVDRLGATRAVVVGGVAAVPDAVVSGLVARGVQVDRVAGDDRYGTAAEVAGIVATLVPGRSGPDAYVVSGTSFADALAVGGVAARTGTPILLTTAAGLPGATQDAIDRLGATTTAIVGGTAAIPEGVEQSLPAPVRIAGPDRYATAAAVLQHARDLDLPFAALVLATGADFPDGLAAGAVAGALDGVVVLVDGQRPTAAGAAFDLAATQVAGVQRLVVMGGTAAVAEGLAEPLR